MRNIIGSNVQYSYMKQIYMNFTVRDAWCETWQTVCFLNTVTVSSHYIKYCKVQ